MSYDPKQHPKHPGYKLNYPIEPEPVQFLKHRRRRHWRRGFVAGLILSALLVALYLVIIAAHGAFK